MARRSREKGAGGRKPPRETKKEDDSWKKREAVPDGWKTIRAGQRIREGDCYWGGVTQGWWPTKDAGTKNNGWATYIRRIRTPQASAKAPGRSRPKSTPPEAEESPMSAPTDPRPDLGGEFEIIGPLDIAIRALQDIADPISALVRDAKEQGYQIDGRAAFDLSKNPEHLRDIARRALKDLGIKDEAEIEAQEDHDRRALDP